MFGNRAMAYFKNKKMNQSHRAISNKATSMQEFDKLINGNSVEKCVAVFTDEYSNNAIYDPRTTSMMFGGVGSDISEAFETVVGAAVARQQYRQSVVGEDSPTLSYVMLYDFKERNLLGGIGIQVQDGAVTTFVMDDKKLNKNNDNFRNSEEVAGQLRIDQMFK